MSEVDQKVSDSLELSRRISALLAGQGPDRQGATLADLVSLWLAGHHPAIRRDVYDSWIETTWKLVGPSERQLKERYGCLPWEK